MDMAICGRKYIVKLAIIRHFSKSCCPYHIMSRTSLPITAYLARLLGTFVLLSHANAQAPTTAIPENILALSIEALGGPSTISQVESVRYVGGPIYRTKGVMESYAMGQDVAVASIGRQNVSFRYEDGDIRQRIDLHHELGAYWLFARPNLEPVDYSLVLEGGNEGFAAIVEGSYSIWLPETPPQGYLDGLLTAFVIREAEKMSPFVVSKILSNNNYTISQQMIGTNTWLPSVHDHVLDISVLFHPGTFLPYVIRSLDNHPLFGPSTYDLLLTNYTRVDGIQFPTRFTTVLNNHHFIGDYTVAQVLVNPSLDAAVFAAPANRSALQTPVRDEEYSFGEMHTWSSSYMWYGRWTRQIADFSITQPIAGLPGVWYLNPGDVPPAYKQVVLEFEDAVVVLDATPHQSRVILQWAREILGRNVTHVWPSHHHGDHAMGLPDYVNAGAKVIVFEDAKDYYTGIREESFITFTTDNPFVLRDGNMRANFIHMNQSFHSFDQSYVVITPTCIVDDSPVAVFDADHLTPRLWDVIEQAAPMELVVRLAYDRVAPEGQLFSAHEFSMPIKVVADFVGYEYPSYSPKDFRWGSGAC
ncbi:hypothetical protein BKA66DRAFT_462501 [Pyrenochaeta sp. MPI-SDFR-AT-0127]|nr:hypothetical protein BKA66DRAFT_462501 [Pyrenochaeta sp. MPI-SDFR-AT-0127]